MNIETESSRTQGTMISYNTCKGISIMQICLFMYTTAKLFLYCFFSIYFFDMPFSKFQNMKIPIQPLSEVFFFKLGV